MKLYNHLLIHKQSFKRKPADLISLLQQNKQLHNQHTHITALPTLGNVLNYTAALFFTERKIKTFPYLITISFFHTISTTQFLFLP